MALVPLDRVFFTFLSPKHSLRNERTPRDVCVEAILNRVYNCVRVSPNYKPDEICLCSEYKKNNDYNVNLLECNS